MFDKISYFVVVGEEFNVVGACGPNVGLVEGECLGQYREEALRVVDVGETAGALLDVDTPGVFEEESAKSELSTVKEILSIIQTQNFTSMDRCFLPFHVKTTEQI